MTKICTKCKTEKPLSEFGKDNTRKSGRTSHCKQCKAAYERNRGKKRPNRIDHRRNRRLGIVERDYLEMFRKQNGKCAICGVSHLELRKRLCIDHDHKTGKVRGLLCLKCNWVLGHCLDSTEILSNAIGYLSKHRMYQNSNEVLSNLK